MQWPIPFGDEEMAADPEEHRFDIPGGHGWDDVRRHSTDIGEHLNLAFRAIEDANVRLRGIFQDVDFNNKERFPDAVLERLLQHFEKYPLRHADVEDDVLGNAYEYLIAKFADSAGKKGGEFYTPGSPSCSSSRRSWRGSSWPASRRMSARSCRRGPTGSIASLWGGGPRLGLLGQRDR